MIKIIKTIWLIIISINLLFVYYFGFDFYLDKIGTISIALFGLLIGGILGCIFKDSSNKYFYQNDYLTLTKLFIFGIFFNILNLTISFVIYFIIKICVSSHLNVL